MKISLPKNIASIIAIINNNGYKAHIVGGCVRDISLIKFLPIGILPQTQAPLL